MSQDRPLKYEAIELTGRMITSVDPIQLGKGDFQDLSNMRYTSKGPRSVKGMTKINTTPLAKPTVGAGYHFVKDDPAESHLLVQGISGSTSAIYDNTTAIPGQGNFTSLYTEASNSSHGKFSPAPDGCIAYGNGQETLLWGGNESRCAGFIVGNTDDTTSTPTNLWDYTSKVTDFDTTTTALIKARYVFIAATRALKGVKFTVATANTGACTAAVYYWNSSGAWAAVAGLSDGTIATGKSLAQTGTISFTSTVGSAQLRYFNNTLAYWYLFDFNGADVTTEISLCTVDAPMQDITDLWDGVPRQLTSFQKYVSVASGYQDYSVNVFAQDFVLGSTTTYVDLNGLASTQHLVVGFTERMQGLKFNLVPDYTNTATATMSISYWTGAAWTALSVTDKTALSGVSLNSTGVAYWTPPAVSAEFTKSVVTPDLFYYYKIEWNATLSYASGVLLDSIFGIPAAATIDTYKFPVMFQNRLCLCNNQRNEGNTILLSSTNTNCVFNGDDSDKLYFGDNREIIAAVPFFSRFSNSFFENLIVGKADSAWIVDGSDMNTYRTYEISSMYGVAAPATMTSCDLGFAGVEGTTASRNVTIWQSASSIVMWDGSIVYPIDDDIKDVFDQSNSYAIDQDMMSSSKGFFDEQEKEWHWLWASNGSSTLDKEYAFDVIRKKWFKIDRGTGKKIQLGISVIDTNNNKYIYGATTDGYIERLEYGQTFDSNNIISYYHTGDIPLGGWMETSMIRKVKPIMKSKSSTTNSMTLTHYGDTSTSATDTITYSVTDATHRIVQIPKSTNKGDFVFHSFKCSMTTSNENICFEPIGIGIFYKQVRLDLI